MSLLIYHLLIIILIPIVKEILSQFIPLLSTMIGKYFKYKTKDFNTVAFEGYLNFTFETITNISKSVYQVK